MSRKSPPTTSVSSGQLQGVWQEDGRVAVFKGIPYAKPPVGDLRWQPPQPPETWEGMRRSDAFGPSAWQYGADFETFLNGLIDGQGWNRLHAWSVKQLIKLVPSPKQAEDCLYLNVRTPAMTPQTLLPVMVWIHGGDHQDGSGSEPFYDSNALASQGVVFVSINYRLGILGYFTHPELSREAADGVSGNYGMLDQIAALRWVQDNIANFGGDPNRVTIFGESAGGESVAHLLTSPLARGLFQQAIMQSPANGGQMIHLTEPFIDYLPSEEMGLRFAAQLGITGNSQLEQLRQVSPKTLYETLRANKAAFFFYPVIDGVILPQSPFAAFAAGNQAKVPLLLGSNRDEGTLIYPVFQAPLIEYRTREMAPNKMPAFMTEAFGEETAQLAALYPGLAERQYQAECDLVGDGMFGAKTRFYAGYAAHERPTFLYTFGRVPPSPAQTAGAFHGAEIPFVHGSSTPILPMNEADKALSEKMIQYWTQFAKTGDPNGSGRPTWEPFSPSDPRWLYFDVDQIEMRPIDREEKYRLLNGRTERLIKAMGQLSGSAHRDLEEANLLT